MIFQSKKSKYYPKYWESEYYAVAVVFGAFDYRELQVLRKIGTNWQVIRTWESYEWKDIEKLIRSIFNSLEDVEDKNPDITIGDKKHWEIVEELLPESNNN